MRWSGWPPVPTRLRKQALARPVAGMDETAPAGGRRETLWLHVLCDGTISPSIAWAARGDIWNEYAGTAVHDRFASYLSQLPEETAHGLCNAHLLRNLEEIVELERAPDGWAARMQRLLLKARDVAAHWLDTTGGPVPEPLREQTAAAWDTLLAPVLDHYESLPPPARGRRRGHNLALALWELRDACLLFMADPAGALHQQPGGAGPAHGQAANEDLGRLPHPGRGRALRTHARPGRDRPQAGANPPRPPAAGPRPRPALTRRRRISDPQAARTGVAEQLQSGNIENKEVQGRSAFENQSSFEMGMIANGFKDSQQLNCLFQHVGSELGRVSLGRQLLGRNLHRTFPTICQARHWEQRGSSPPPRYRNAVGCGPDNGVAGISAHEGL